jgi:carbamoyltransferase
VEREVNPLYWRLISEFGRRTGVPVVMNTSFNLRGEPIVNSPADAVRTFFSSGMDALFMGNFLVEK